MDICFFEKKHPAFFQVGYVSKKTLEGKQVPDRNLGDLYDRKSYQDHPLILEFSIYETKYNKWSYVFAYTHVDM